METQPLISVLIPTYNVAPYVEEAIRSIMDQTYRNLEIIVVDDCSKDNTYEILQRLAKEDSRISLYKNERNKKIVETLNYAIKNAKGEYFARMDGDDVSLPTRIATQFDYLQQHPEIALVGLNVIMVDEKSKEIHRQDYLQDYNDIKVAAEYISPIPHFWLSRRSLYDTVGLYRIPSAEDLDFILRSIDAGFKLANIPDFLYLQRMRDGNTATALGLFQKKSIAFVRKLHKERLATNSETYSEDILKKALEAGWLETKSFKISSKFHFSYVKTKSSSKLKALVYRGLSVVFSPKHQLNEVYTRFKYKSMIKS